MKFWQLLAFVEFDQIIECAQFAEQLGFHGVTFGDHLVTTEKQVDAYLYNKDSTVFWQPQTHWPDPWVMIAALARECHKLHFMTTIYVLPMRDPFSVAKSISTAAYLSNDRITLGIGVGWQKTEFELTGQDYHTRGKRCDEQIEVIKRLTSGEMVEFHGEFYDFEPLMMSPGTHKPIPIFIGGHSKPAFRRAIQHDGWLGLRYSPEQIPEFITRLEQARLFHSDKVKLQKQDFDIWLAPAVQAKSDYQDIAAMGVTMVNGANFLVEGKVVPTTLNFKKQRMEEFANKFIV